ncbi:MAG TPA: hexose kinase, partial [Terracidiphilus sp.]
MILTLTLNPAVDRTVLVDKLVFEDRGYIHSHTEVAGGRGVNASHVLHAFGAKTLALLTSGGEIGKRMEQGLSGMGFPYETVRVKAESRSNLTISDRQGLTIKLNERGVALESDEIQTIMKLVEARLPRARWLMICGSLQPGIPPHLYCEIIQMAKRRGVKTLLDTDGDALNHALEAKPTVIKPNQQEAERLLGRAIITRSQSLEAMDRIRAMGPEMVILSMGSRGALGASQEGV